VARNQPDPCVDPAGDGGHRCGQRVITEHGRRHVRRQVDTVAGVPGAVGGEHAPIFAASGIAAFFNTRPGWLRGQRLVTGAVLATFAIFLALGNSGPSTLS
jgi:hypothetical protein